MNQEGVQGPPSAPGTKATVWAAMVKIVSLDMA